MKKLRMAFTAIVAVSSIGTAFAFSPAAKTTAVTYYSVKSPSGFRWTTNQPTSLSCNRTNLNSTCSITTSHVPAPNSVPAGHVADGTIND